uniref:Cnidarian restricted protein n=1 Tax=Clytia hemisphaerica TaxID=252671 RepID=A0A7M5WQ37_9CNID
MILMQQCFLLIFSIQSFSWTSPLTHLQKGLQAGDENALNTDDLSLQTQSNQGKISDVMSPRPTLTTRTTISAYKTTLKTTTTTTKTKYQRRSKYNKQKHQRFVILSNRKAPPCCVAGTKAGSWGYLCMAHERFVTERFFLPHPLKVKFTRRRSYVQLALAKLIQQCSRHPVTAKQYEKCCDNAQHRLYQRMGLDS